MIMPVEQENTKPKRFDIVIVDHGSESLIYVNRRMPERKATRWVRDFLETNERDCGIMLLPAGSEAPSGYEVADLDDFEVLA